MIEQELTWQRVIDVVLAGQVVKLPCSTQKGAEAVRQSIIEFVLAKTTEPIEVIILGSEPALEVWIRRLHGGLPLVWMCLCGFSGTEEQVSKHAAICAVAERNRIARDAKRLGKKN